ncbi:cryptochrome/photolyase family protein [Endozoicomonadaceae bacterium StTr2]
MSHYTSLVWFRQDLRIEDNPALQAGCQKGRVLAVYILDDEETSWSMGGASKVWLHHALQDLDKSLQGNLLCLQGNAASLIPELVKQYKIESVFWNRCYEPWRIHRDIQLKSSLRDQGVEVESFNGSLLWEPWKVLKKDQTPYRVFTPFYRKGCLAASAPRMPLPAPESLNLVTPDKKVSFKQLNLLPEIDWHQPMLQHWDISEQGASRQLEQFLESGLQNYKEGRDFPAMKSVSKLSPYLHFGLISPHQVWHQSQMNGMSDQLEKQLDHFQSELGWREFSYYLLYHFPTLPEKNFQPKFDSFPWRTDDEALRRWKSGQTGYPIIDAGMRELWQTGYMHNRVRMIVASFLIKNLMIDWREGAKWFWDTLFDADLANNSASWQWVAGCGADAAPYFRIFNPVTQSKKFDPDGEYIRRFVPELSDCSSREIHAPWESSKADSIDYPQPVVDLQSSRKEALEAFKQL